MAKTLSGQWVEQIHVQTFVRVRRELRAEEPRQMRDIGAALRLTERLAGSREGVVVMSQRMAPELGEYEAPRIEATHGRVPPQALELMSG